MDDANELVARLSTAAAIIMEDNGPLALTALPADNGELSARLAQIEQAGKDVTVLIQAAQVLAQRGLR